MTAPLPQHLAEICEDLAFEMIAETTDQIESINNSLREAAFRRDHAEVRLRLGHLRLCVIAMTQTMNELDGQQGPAP